MSNQLKAKIIPLKKYPELIQRLKNLPTVLTKVEATEKDKIIQALPEILSMGLVDVYAILAFALDTEQERIEQLSLKEAIQLIDDILTVNEFDFVYDYLKKKMEKISPKK